MRSGIGPELEKPSKRYGSVPTDGPAQGQDVSKHWDEMVDIWYGVLGYYRATGKPKADTLKKLGLENVAKELWG